MEEALTQVFDGFQVQRDPVRRRMNPYGNGIGLRFCRQICQSLDGDISVESVQGLGSEFTFWMRVNEANGGSLHERNDIQDDWTISAIQSSDKQTVKNVMAVLKDRVADEPYDALISF